ncbi:O-antigen ligase family protein [Bradyrhizobium valentinum]|uniref:O-antigen ligase-related domain-containing protein n=1 Tax=Bradyrhizobium valentinum TaxID=1518501 RepID=A0A0R3KSI3_9BRAD|nr:O-antigen ligase family protein [Bradyrhizobium valentinum]KRQ98362.1 hypothetical protein CP49_10525 [Bradyrhizobium valentinum]
MMRVPKAASFAFALAISASSIFALIYGSLGLSGYGAFTASYLSLTVIVIAVFGSLGDFRFSSLDIPVLTLIACAGISVSRNPQQIDFREVALLGLTISAYFAGRSLVKEDVPVLRAVSFWISLAILSVGTALTVPYLVLHGELGRPFVLGFDNATTAFSVSLGILVILLLSSEYRSPTWVRNALVALIAFSMAIFAASMVRFSLLAIMVCTALSALLLKQQRRFALSLLAILVASTAFGLLARFDNANLYVRYAIEGARGEVGSGGLSSATILPPSYAAQRNPEATTADCESVNTRNSIAIRKQLISDAVNLIPRAGLFGFGFMSFGRLGCFEGASPHNDLLQAFVEFGWMGGVAFLTLIALIPLLLLKPARLDGDLRFVFLLSAFMIMLSMVYGQIGRDLPLFLVLGLAVSVLSSNDGSAASRVRFHILNWGRGPK